MSDLTIEQQWELLRTWAQTLVNHAKSKDAHHLRQDLAEVTNAVNMILVKPTSLADQVAEIEREIEHLERANLRLEARFDVLDNLPRNTSLEQADITAEIRANKERIQELQTTKASLTGDTPPF